MDLLVIYKSPLSADIFGLNLFDTNLNKLELTLNYLEKTGYTILEVKHI